VSYFYRFTNKYWWMLVVFCALDFIMVYVPLASAWILLGLFIPRISGPLIALIHRAQP